MRDEKTPRRLRIVVTDEDTGERIAVATGVNTLALIVAPDTLHGDIYRHLVVGDPEIVQALLLDTLEDVMEANGGGAVFDLSELLQSLLEEAVGDLPVH